MSLVFQNINPPPPSLGEGEDTLAGRRGGGGSIFWKTRDIGLPYYSNNLSTVASQEIKDPTTLFSRLLS